MTKPEKPPKPDPNAPPPTMEWLLAEWRRLKDKLQACQQAWAACRAEMAGIEQQLRDRAGS